MKRSYLPEDGNNLFQSIKAKTMAAEAAGIKVWKLTIGQPSGPALETARMMAAKAVKSDKEAMHEYQDNGSPGVPGFAQEFITIQQSSELIAGLAYLPIPGIKPMLPLIPMACGSIVKHQDLFVEDNLVGTMTDPGYPIPKTWCDYLGVRNYPLLTNPDNGFLFESKDISSGTSLLMLNYPHNPSGQVATEKFWYWLCPICATYDIRLFNDAAYAMLATDPRASTLAQVAQHFPDLSWAEAYSASKIIGNGTGWRNGAIVGSPDFVADIAMIKGNTDSGFFAPAAYGVLECMKNDMAAIIRNREIYRERIDILKGLLLDRNMKLAVNPGAGFFTLWNAPREAFGQSINKNGEKFNNLMIEKTGVAGVHFGQYIRYAVTSPLGLPEWQKAIADAFEKAEVKY